jgi:hypothetical protein
VKTLKLNIIGTTPLLMNNPASMLDQSSGDLKVPARQWPVSDEEAEKRAYRDEDGYLVFPASAIRSCLLRAAVNYKIGKKAATTVLKGAIIDVASPSGSIRWLSLEDSQGQLIVGYTVDRQSVVVNRARVIRSRPRLDEWIMPVDVVYDEQFASEDHILGTLERGGITVGLGDFRPEKSGRYGRFRVETR